MKKNSDTPFGNHASENELISPETQLEKSLADTVDVTYLDEAGIEKTISARVINAQTDSLTNGWYAVNSDVTRLGTIKVTGDVYLILADGRTLRATGTNGKAGINVTGDNKSDCIRTEGRNGFVELHRRLQWRRHRRQFSGQWRQHYHYWR